MAVNNMISDAGEWNTAGNWSLGHVPLTTEDTTFTGIVTPGVSLTITTTNAVAKTIDFSTAGAVFTLSGGVAELSVYGSLTLKSGMTWSHTAGTYMRASGNLDTNGVSMSDPITVTQTGACTIINNAVNIGVQPFYVRGGGSLVTNNLNITCGLFSDSSISGNTTLTLGTSTINCTNVSFGSATLTVTHTGAINITSTAGATANFGGKTWGGTITVIPSSTKTVTINGANTFATLTLNGTGQITLGANTIVTGALTHTLGIIELNGKTLTVGSQIGHATNTIVLKDTAGGGKIVTTGLTGTVFDYSGSGVTVSNAPAIDIGTSNLTQTGDVTFAKGGKTFGNFKVTKHAGDYDCIITG